MRRRVLWHHRRNGNPRVQLYGWSRHQAHDRAEIAGAVQARRIRDITRRAKGVSIKTTMEELATYMRGWRGYFGFCETPEVLIALTRWVRLRLRAALWRQWKTPRRRRAHSSANGVSEWAARNTAGSGRGPWYLARSRALSTGLSNAYFKNRSACHPCSNRVSATSRTAVYGPVRTVVWEGGRCEAPPYPDHWHL